MIAHAPSRLAATSTTHRPTNGSPDLQQRAEERLRASPYLALRYVSCACHDDVVTLGGRVPSYYLKQLAQTLISQIEGVRRVENHVEVA